MVIPKFNIGQYVFIYERGKLAEKVVKKIQILITEESFKVGYQFEQKDKFLRMLGHDFYVDESEVFNSLDEFVKINS